MNELELKKTKLVKLPSLFEENPNLLEKVLKVEMIKRDGNIDPIMRQMYTKCDCSGDFYWQNEKIEKYDIEILGCDTCENWTIQVTY